MKAVIASIALALAFQPAAGLAQDAATSPSNPDWNGSISRHYGIARAQPDMLTVGTFKFRFDDKGFDAFQAIVGPSRKHRTGDAGDSFAWLCYGLPHGQRLWVTSGELGNTGNAITGAELRVMPPQTPASPDCPSIALNADIDGVRLGITRAQITAVLGDPVKSTANQLLYTYDTRTERGDDVTGSLFVYLTNGRVSRMIAQRVITD